MSTLSMALLSLRFMVGRLTSPNVQKRRTENCGQAPLQVRKPCKRRLRQWKYLDPKCIYSNGLMVSMSWQLGCLTGYLGGCIYVHACMCAYVYMNVYVYKYLSLCLYIYIYFLFRYIYIYVYIYMYTYSCIYIYICAGGEPFCRSTPRWAWGRPRRSRAFARRGPRASRS